MIHWIRSRYKWQPTKECIRLSLLLQRTLSKVFFLFLFAPNHVKPLHCASGEQTASWGDASGSCREWINQVAINGHSHSLKIVRQRWFSKWTIISSRYRAEGNPASTTARTNSVGLVAWLALFVGHIFTNGPMQARLSSIAQANMREGAEARSATLGRPSTRANESTLPRLG